MTQLVIEVARKYWNKTLLKHIIIVCFKKAVSHIIYLKGFVSYNVYNINISSPVLFCCGHSFWSNYLMLYSHCGEKKCFKFAMNSPKSCDWIVNMFSVVPQPLLIQYLTHNTHALPTVPMASRLQKSRRIIVFTTFAEI